MRRLAATVAAAALLAALAGCSAIPVSGPVMTAASQDADQPGQVVLTPARPVPGAQPADIVRNFLAASTGPQNHYGIAHAYLTSAFAKQWNPNARVLLSQGALHISAQVSAATAVVQAAVPVAATLAANGVYTSATTPTLQTLGFRLQRASGGEWRISSAPPGVVLQLNYFSRLFAGVPLEYYTPDFTELVPDLRWFPVRGDATQVVRRLLAGATGPIASPVTDTAFPAGAALRRPVDIEGATAVVDLRVPSGTPRTEVLDRMHRQLYATLTGLASVDRIELLINGVPQPDARDAALSPSSVGDAPLVLRGSVFGYASAGKFTPDTVLGAAVVKARPVAVTASVRLSRAAVQTHSGSVVLVPASGKPVTVDSRPGLVAPALDQDGWVWSVQASSPAALQASQGGKPVTLPIVTDANQVTAIEVSPDGTRLLVVLDGSQNPHVMVAGIVRNDDGAPIGITASVADLPVIDPSVIDATWADSRTIALLTQAKDGTEDVVLQPIGGLASSDGSPIGATSIVGGRSQADLWVLGGQDGRDVQQTSQGTTIWQPVATDVDLLAVQR